MASLAKIMKFYFSCELPFSIIHVSNLEIKTSLLLLTWQVKGHSSEICTAFCSGQWLSPYLGKEKDILLPTLAFCDLRTQVKSMTSFPQNFLKLLIKSQFFFSSHNFNLMPEKLIF